MAAEQPGHEETLGLAASPAQTHERLAWRVEEAELNALPSIRQLLAGGWVLRFSEGGPRRGTQSASPLDAGCEIDDVFIDTTAALYRRRGSNPLFRIPSLIPASFDAALAGRGYEREGETRVLYGSIDGIPEFHEGQVRLLSSPSIRWFAAMAALQGYSAEQARVYRRMMRSIVVPAAFAILSIDGAPAALAYGAVHDRLLVYESVITDSRLRRQGLARRVLASLGAWGRSNGARTACLQVEASNAPGLGLYHAIGLTSEISRYHYRRAPESH